MGPEDVRGFLLTVCTLASPMERWKRPFHPKGGWSLPCFWRWLWSYLQRVNPGQPTRRPESVAGPLGSPRGRVSQCHPAWPAWAQPSLDQRLTLWSWEALIFLSLGASTESLSGCCGSDPGSQPQHEVTRGPYFLAPCPLDLPGMVSLPLGH